MRRVLFVTATRIGDAVLSTGLLSHLVETQPGARITVAAGPVAAPLFAGVPGLERVVVVEKRRWSMHWPLLWAEVVARRWDLVVDLRGSALPWLLLARERRVMIKGDDSLHKVEHLGRVLGLAPPPAPRLWMRPEDEREATALVPPGGPFLAVGPAANWRGKQWRAERFAELALRLTSSDGLLPQARVAVMAAAHERPQAAPLLSALPEARRIDLVGRVGLLAAAAVLRRATLFVGNDTGLMHIAAAAGAPTLGLFGPTQARQYAPWGPRTAVAQTATPADELYGPGFDHRTTDSMMDSLTVDAAQEAARGLLLHLGRAA
jgi:ADP-heptose:LPS heptosyltransferase